MQILQYIIVDYSRQSTNFPLPSKLIPFKLINNNFLALSLSIIFVQTLWKANKLIN